MIYINKCDVKQSFDWLLMKRRMGENSLTGLVEEEEEEEEE